MDNHVLLLIVGLGNPGTKYEGSRHNVGFAVVDALAAQCGARMRKGWFGNAETGTCRIGDRALLLAKPTTFMNASGRAVAALVKRHTPETIVVVHDDLDLPIGTIRVKTSGSSGGHRGVASIIAHLKTESFTRIRIGVGPNVDQNGHRIPAEQFVLQQFAREERPVVAHAIAEAVRAIESVAT